MEFPGSGAISTRSSESVDLGRVDFLTKSGRAVLFPIYKGTYERDIDVDRLAYYGLSWGGALGAILPATDKRIRANVLYVAGLNFQRALPEVDEINYVTRVTQPTLILNGEVDFFFPS